MRNDTIVCRKFVQAPRRKHRPEDQAEIWRFVFSARKHDESLSLKRHEELSHNRGRRTVGENCAPTWYHKGQLLFFKDIWRFQNLVDVERVLGKDNIKWCSLADPFSKRADQNVRRGGYEFSQGLDGGLRPFKTDGDMPVHGSSLLYSILLQEDGFLTLVDSDKAQILFAALR
jgi:hypothetical protein